MPHGLSQETVDKLRRLFARFEKVEEVILYGSRAKGNFRPGSDVDLTLKGEGLDLQLLNKISRDIDDLLLPYAFDISIFRQIKNQELLDLIDRVGVIFYRRVSGSTIRGEKKFPTNQ